MRLQAMTLLVVITTLSDERQALGLFNNFLEEVRSFPLSLTLQRDKVQFTLLHIAVSKRWPELVELILNLNTKQDFVNQLKKDSIDQEGDTPLHIAVLKNDWQLVRTLMRCYFPVMLLNKNGASAFSLALEGGADKPLLEMLYDVAMLQRCTNDLDEHIATCLEKARQLHSDITWALPNLESSDKQLVHFVAQYQDHGHSDPHKARQYYENILQVLKVLKSQIDAKITLSEDVLLAMVRTLHFYVNYSFVESAVSIVNMLRKIPSFDMASIKVGLTAPVSAIPIVNYLNGKIQSVLLDAVKRDSLDTLGRMIADLYSLLFFLTDKPDFTVTTELLLSLLENEKKSSGIFDFICTMVEPFFERTPQRLETICEKLITIYLDRSKFIESYKKLTQQVKKALKASQTALYKLLTTVIAANKNYFTDALRDQLAQPLCKNKALLTLWETYGFTLSKLSTHTKKKGEATLPKQSMGVVAAAAIVAPVTAQPSQTLVISRETALVPRLASRSPSPNPTAEPWSSEDEAAQQKLVVNKKSRGKKQGGKKHMEEPVVTHLVSPNTSSLAIAMPDSIDRDSDAKSSGAVADLASPASPVSATGRTTIGSTQFIFGLPPDQCYQPSTFINEQEHGATAVMLPGQQPPILSDAVTDPEIAVTDPEIKKSPHVLNVAATPFQPRTIKIPGYPSNSEPFYIDPTDLRPGLPRYDFEQENLYRQQQRLEGLFTAGMRRVVILSGSQIAYIELVNNQQTGKLRMELKNEQAETLSDQSIIKYVSKHDRRVVAIVYISGNYVTLSANPLEGDWLQSNAAAQQHVASLESQMRAMMLGPPYLNRASIFPGAQRLMRPPRG